MRNNGVLILGSGNVVHNLPALSRYSNQPAYDWAIGFDELAGEMVDTGNHPALTRLEHIEHLATLAHPTTEHYLPLLYTLGASDQSDTAFLFNQVIELASISMRSVVLTQ